MIKIMAVIHSLAGGGAERVMVSLLKTLDRRHFSITLVLFDGCCDYTPPEDVEILILHMTSSRNILKQARSFILRIISLSRLIRKRRPDIVFSMISGANVIAILAKIFSRTQSKVIVSERNHPSESLKNERYGQITRLFMRFLYPRTERIIAISEGIKKDLLESFGLSETMIEVIYNPVDIEEIELLSRAEVSHPWFSENIPILIAVGRLTKQKGLSYLIKAFSLVKQKLSSRLVIIGKGEEEAKLFRLAHSMGLKGDIDFLGFQPNPFRYMAKSSLLVLPSLYEGFANVIVEAMAVGLPVVSTDCQAGPSEIIENKKNGVLVPVKDEKALKDAILDVLSDDGMKRCFSKEGKRRSEFFALSVIIKQYSNVFFKVAYGEKR